MNQSEQSPAYPNPPPLPPPPPGTAVPEGSTCQCAMPTASAAPTAGPTAAPPRKKRRGCLTALLLAGIVMIVLGFVGFSIMAGIGLLAALLGDSFASTRQFPVSEKIVHHEPETPDKIAVIDIQGIIVGSDNVKAVSPGMVKMILGRIAQDEHVVAIVLNLDTPGGEVIASDEIYQAIASVDLPVVACMRSVCASGGYYIAAAADYIVANEVTLTGSIGVIIPRYRYQGLLEKVGIETAAIKSGDMKDMFSGGKDRTDDEEAVIDAYVQELVDETFRRFCTVVAEGRDRYLTWEDVKQSPFGDGRILLGRQARELGLVDECGYFEQAIAAARRLADVETASVVRYKRDFSFAELLFSQAEAHIKLETGLEAALPRLEPTRMYYLMPNLLD